MKNSIFIIFFAGFFSTTNLFSQNSFNVIVKGKGNPILLFPSFGCTGQIWNETVAEISKTHKCYIFTFAGFGNTKSIETPWFQTIKKDLEKYIVENKLTKSTLLGHSLGGTMLPPKIQTKINKYLRYEKITLN